MHPASQGIRLGMGELLLLHAEARRLSLAGPDVVSGLFPGVYRSLFRGRGLDFEEVRGYQWGDDFRSLDWRVTARTGRPHTKVFREEREHTLLLALDAGASMRFGTRRALKWVAAAEAIAIIAWLAADNGDRVGGLIFGDGPACHERRPLNGRAGALDLFRMIERAPAHEEGPGAGLAEALARLRHVARPGSLVLIASDFAGLDDEAEEHLAALARRHDVAGLLVRDPLEAGLPPPGRYAFGDGAEVLELDTAEARLRAAYQDDFKARRERAQAVCRRLRVRLADLETAQPAADGLRDGLFRLAVPANRRRKASAHG